MNKKLDWSKPIKTKGGSAYMLYHVVQDDYCNGAWYEADRDIWIPCQHDFQGNYAEKKSALDLVNI
jgi:hypothetical protein